MKHLSFDFEWTKNVPKTYSCVISEENEIIYSLNIRSSNCEYAYLNFEITASPKDKNVNSLQRQSRISVSINLKGKIYDKEMTLTNYANSDKIFTELPQSNHYNFCTKNSIYEYHLQFSLDFQIIETVDVPTAKERDMNFSQPNVNNPISSKTDQTPSTDKAAVSGNKRKVPPIDDDKLDRSGNEPNNIDTKKAAINNEFVSKQNETDKQIKDDKKEIDYGKKASHEKDDTYINSKYIKSENNEKNNNNKIIEKDPKVSAHESPDQSEYHYKGLYNQGATCYVNSALQTLFHLPCFRKIVYQIPVEKDNKDIIHDVPFQLQVLFYNLQCGESPSYSTKDLTVSFGWDHNETLIQQDIQEFLRQLISNLEEKIIKSKLLPKDTISKLFGGRTIQTVSSISGKILSELEEMFYDLSINVASSLMDSLKSYFKNEYIDNYMDEKDGIPRKVICNTKIVKLPKILQIHLKRYKYNDIQDVTFKNDDEMSFDKELDMREFLTVSLNQEKNLPTKYQLFGVLVHSGEATGGHYYVYCRPSQKENWYEFNDTAVEQVSEDRAIKENFGGRGRYSRYSINPRDYSAYMLIYVRCDVIDEIFVPISLSDIPQHVVQYAHEHKKVSPNKRIRNKNDVIFTVITEDCIRANCKLGILGIENREREFRITIEDNEENSNMEVAYIMISESMKIESDCLRLWKLDLSHKLNTVIDYKEECKSISPRIIFAQKKDKTEKLLLKDGSATIFLKLYTGYPESPFIYLCMKTYEDIIFIKSEQIISDIYNIIFPDENRRKTNGEKLFIENETSAVVISNTHICFPRISNGSIIVGKISRDIVNKINRKTMHKLISIDKLLVDEDDQNGNGVTRYNDVMVNTLPEDPSTFYDSQYNTKIIELYDFSDLRKSYGKIAIPTSLTKPDDLFKFISLVYEPLNVDKNHTLLLFENDESINAPKSPPIKKDDSYLFIKSKKLYCLILTKIDCQDIKNYETYFVLFSNDGYNIASKSAFFLPKESTVGKILCMFDDSINDSDDDNKAIRAFEIDKDGNFINNKEISKKEKLKNVNKTLRVEKAPRDQIGCHELFPVYHAFFNSDTSLEISGFPFFFKAISNESGEKLKERLKQALNLSDSIANHIRLYFPYYLRKTYYYNTHYTLKKDELYYIKNDPNFKKNTVPQVLILIHSSSEKNYNSFTHEPVSIRH